MFGQLFHRRVVLAVAALLLVLRTVCADHPGVIRGKLLVPGGNYANASVYLHTTQGHELRTFCNSDGSFVFQNVPAGSHLLQPHHMSFFFPEVKVDIHKKHGLIRSSLTAQPKVVLHSPLVIRPLMPASYFEKRKPIDVWSFVKSPYGIMMVMSVLVIFVFPKMKVDPEEFKELQQQLRGGNAEQPANNRVRDR